MDPNEDVYKAEREEDVHSDTDDDTSMDQFMDKMARMDQLDDEMELGIERMLQLIDDMELEDHLIDEMDRMNELDDEIDEMDHMDRLIYEMDHPLELDGEDFVDTDADQDDLTGELDDGMFHALSQMASSLCPICREFARGIFQAGEKDYSEYLLHHLSLSSLQRSIDRGCRLCMALAQVLEDFCKRSDPPVHQKESWSIKGAFRRMKSTLCLGFWLCQCEHDHPYGSICEDARHIHTFDFYPARKLGLGPEFLGVLNDRCDRLSTAPANLSVRDPTLRTSSAKSATSFAVARSWYQQCLNHAACRNWRQESRVLPTRLIQIWRPDDQSTDLSARICETKGFPRDTPYVTLSHCWGKVVIFKLLQNNLQELSKAIPIGQLPKVFKDAIHVSYELGISYIWIDSLCIIQDSKDDWTYEAKLMGGVYANGEFNIAATGYEDGLSGLFGERKAFSFVHIPMRIECEFINDEYETTGVFDGIYVAASSDEFRHHVVFSPLNDRGWVAQERVLSPAVLHYTPEKTYWECNQCISSEAFLNGSSIWEKTGGTGQDRIRSLSTQSRPEDIYSFWRAFLERYAGMAMTFNSDRFPALAGIAGILAELLDDNFVAGFWEGDLLRSLVLDRHIHPRNSIMPEQIAPSWSWASMNADTSIANTDMSRIEPLNGVRFRVLSDLPGFHSDLQSPSFERSGVRGLAIKGVLRKLREDFDQQKEWILSTLLMYDNKKPAKFLGNSLPPEQGWRLGDPTHMLLLARQCDTADDTFVDVRGLLVQRAESDEPNTFRRSGTIELSFYTGEKCDEYLGLREKDGGYESSLFFEESGLQDLVLI